MEQDKKDQENPTAKLTSQDVLRWLCETSAHSHRKNAARKGKPIPPPSGSAFDNAT